MLFFRCSLCSKLLEGDKSKYFGFEVDKHSDKPSLRTFSKHYQSGLVPKTICFTNSGTRIEIKVDESDLDKLNCYLGKIKRPQYKNTLALRQQKMRYC